MTDDYERYEIECERIREDNEKLLDQFEDWLHGQGLGEKTINKHIGNIDFYINAFLLYEDAVEAKAGAYSINMFLGYWFIKKAMWASVSSIRSNAASLKKFYAFLNEFGLVENEAVEFLKEEIKEEMPNWLETLRRYDDASITEMEEVWGL